VAAVRVDVAVLGGGIAGVGVAAELARSGTTVALLEAEDRLAYHATGRSAATFLESYGSAEIRALTRASRAALSTGDPDEPRLLTPRPLLWVAAAGDHDRVARLVAAEPRLRAVDEEQARALLPVLRPGWLGAAAVEDAAQDLDVAGLFERYRRLARTHGADLRTGAGVARGHRDGSGWRLWTAAGDEVHAGVVVNAAGAWADVVARRCAVTPIGVRPLRRSVAIVTAPRVDRGWPLVCEVTDAFYFRPEGDALLVSPADETPTEPADARPSTEDIALGLDRVNEATTLGLRHVRTTWAGLRTFAPDHNPVVGYDPAHPGFFWLAGQGGYGMQTAPALARLAAAIVHSGPIPPDILAQGLDPARLAPDRLRP
jgi:D-arginine dehydrogenase